MQARRLGLGAIMLAVLLLAAAVFSSRAFSAPEITSPSIADARVRLPVVPGRPAAGYFVLTGGAKADRLVGVASPMAGRIEMHSMSMDGGVMRMRAEPGFDVPARGKLVFAPGGNHLMLFDLKPGAKAGAALPLTFRFASGASVRASATAEAFQPAASSANVPEDHRHH